MPVEIFDGRSPTFLTTFQAEFELDAGVVRLDRTSTDVRPGGNLMDSVSPAKPKKDLFFLPAQIDGRARLRSVDDPGKRGGGPAAHKPAARRNRLNGRRQNVVELQLGSVTEGTGSEGPSTCREAQCIE